MRSYDMRDVEFLQLQQTPVEVNGTRIIIKNSPSEPRPGCIDHHEKEALALHWVARGATSDAPEDADLSPMERMRDNMGYPNRNLCTVEIHTQFETLHNGENEIGLWRYYRRDTKRKKNRPAILFIHGGGWVGGTVYTVENPCRLLAELTGGVVFNVDYALAPEKKYPNGVMDCWTALKHIYDHADEYGIDKNKIAVTGDSAGGNITAVLARMDLDRGTHMVALQAPMYGVMVLKGSACPGYHFTIKEYEFDPEQEADLNPRVAICRPKDEDHNDEILFGDIYFDDPERQALEVTASPAMAESFEGLAPCISFCCEYDGLRVQDEFYCKKLQEAGVPCKSIRYRGIQHAVIDRLGFVPQAEDICIELANAVKAL